MTNQYLSSRIRIILLILLIISFCLSSHLNAYASDTSDLSSSTDTSEVVTPSEDLQDEESLEVDEDDSSTANTQTESSLPPTTDDPYAQLQETYHQSQVFKLKTVASEYQNVSMDDYVVDVIPYYDAYQDVIVNSHLNETDNKGRGNINPYLKKIVIPDTINVSDFGHVELTINFKDHATGDLLKSCQYTMSLSDVIDEYNLFKKDGHYYILNTDTMWKNIMMTYSQTWDYDEISTMIENAPIYHEVGVQTSTNKTYNRVYYHVGDNYTYTSPTKLFENAIVNESIQAQGTGRLALAAVGHYWSDDDSDNYIYAYDYNDIDVIGKNIYLYEEGDEEDPIVCLYKGDELLHDSDITDLYEYYSYGSTSFTLHDYGFVTLWLDANLNLKASVDIMVDRTGSLTLEKRVENHEANENELYEFHIRFSKDQQPWTGQVDINDIPDNVTVSGLSEFEGGLVSIYDYLTVKMPADTSLTLKNIPVGVSYEIEEVANDQYTVQSVNESGVIDADGETSQFTNIYSQPHDLSLDKRVIGNLGNHQEYFTFNVHLSHLKANEHYTVDLSQCDETAGTHTNASSITSDKNGNASCTFYLKDLQTITLKSLPDLAHFDITEHSNDYQVSFTTSLEDSGTNQCIGDLSDDLSIHYINKREGVIPTGHSSYQLSGLFIVFICLLLIVRRLRHHHV